MKSFLESVAEHLIEHYPDRISKVCIVLPNRRAGLFLKKHLANLLGKISWGPTIFSIEDFIQDLSDDMSINTLRTIFELYEVHKEIEGKNAQKFDEFYKWGSVLIQDFNELDLHMVDAKNLYNYLSEVKSLAEWKLEFEELSSFQTNYLKFFQSIFKYYTRLNERLTKRKMAYNGRLYRTVAENIENYSQKPEWDQVIFAGFNALSLAEEKILFSLKEQRMAEFLWDVDSYYLNHANSGVFHEAGLFFRKYFRGLKDSDLKWVENNLKTDVKNIGIYGVPQQIGQAKFCGQLLQQNSKNATFANNSAIILADENMLIPVLNSIPGEYSELNVTMGLPLSTSPLFGFFNNLFKIQIYLKNKKSTLTQSELRFRYTDVSKCLRHSITSGLNAQLFKNPNYSSQSVLAELKASGQTDYSLAELTHILKAEDLDTGFTSLVFSDWQNQPKKAIEIFQQLIEILRDATISKQNEDQIDLKIELELLYQFSILLNKIEAYVTEYGSINSVKILHSIFLQICNTQKLPLFGEPLKGLQLMGMLESRNLDFDNLIILSVNENILPSSGKQVSFIPFELKREFEIPTYREKNAIFAYHFFRLIQRAKNISIVYNSQPDLLAGGDKSRFIHQITDELTSYNPQIKIHEKSVSSIINLKGEKPIAITKNKDVLKRLDEVTEKGISASSLNAYVRCKLQFYFKQIAKLGEPEDLSDTIDAATLGTIIHEALRTFYQPFKNKILNAEELIIQLKNADKFISSAFKTHFKSGNLKYGKNLLVVNVAQELFKNFIKYEIKELSNSSKNSDSKSITSLEQGFTATLKLQVNGKPKHVDFHGFIDRIQTINGITEIIDYKTGVVNSNDLVIKSWDDLITDKKLDKAFQLLLYTWILGNSLDNQDSFVSGIYPLKKISNGFLRVKLPEHTNEVLTRTDLREFELRLTELLIEIFNPAIKFEQTDDLTTCKYCSYRSICNK